MPRLVLTGTPASLLRVTQADLAQPLQFMYAYRADFSGLDFSGLDLRDSDLIECDMANTNLTGANVAMMNCRATPFTGCVLPSDMWYCTNGLVEEVMRQQRGLVARRHRTWYDRIIGRVETENGSWTDSLHEASLSVPLLTVRNVLVPVFEPWRSLRLALARGLRDVANGGSQWLPLGNTITRIDGATLALTAPATTLPDDRLEAGAILRQQIEAFLGEPVRVQVFKLTPFLWFRWREVKYLRSPDREDWWRGTELDGRRLRMTDADDDEVEA